MSRPPRRLFLHLSALSDEEYTAYTHGLRDILDLNDNDSFRSLSEEEMETQEIGIREVRAWMKGRYRDVSDIDKILHMFSADFTAKDIITGGQFLAALRLLMHARHGIDVTEANAFIQADPSSPILSTRRGSIEPDMAPSSFDPPSTDHSTNPFYHDHALQPPPAVPAANAKPPSLPVRRSSVSHLPPQQRTTSRMTMSDSGVLNELDRPPAADATDFVVVPPSSTNPFLQRAKTHSGIHRSGAQALANMGIGEGGADASNQQPARSPPLPPRKPTHMSRPSVSANFTPPLHPSIRPSSPPKSIVPLHPIHPSHAKLPPIPSGLSQSAISPLMKQSLEASKMGQSMKRAQEQAEKERVLEVIRSSAPVTRMSGVQNSRSSSKSAEMTTPHPYVSAPRRPVPSPPHSVGTTAGSTTSLEQVASARLRPSSRLSSSPDRKSLSSASQASSSKPYDPTSPYSAHSNGSSSPFAHSAPPTHPDRRVGGHQYSTSMHSSRSSPAESPFVSTTNDLPDSPTGQRRTSRSQSVNHPSSTGRNSPPQPPPRRRRPDSVQVLALPDSTSSTTIATAGNATSPFEDTNTSSEAQVISTSAFGPRSAGLSNLNPDSQFSNKRTPSLSQMLSSSQNQQQSSSPHSAPLSFSTLQRTLSQLQTKAQPTLDRLDRTRYKAEAGLTKRGFVPDSHSGLLRNNEDGADADDGYVDPDTDGGAAGMSRDIGTWSDEEDDFDTGNRGRSRFSDRGHMRDDLKLPEGEGWTPL